VRLLALTSLFTAAAVYEGAHLSALATPEIWVHLRTGIWILQNHSIPRTGLFSQYSNLPWNDSSWGFDLLMADTYQLFGLRAIPILLMLLKVALALATFQLARAGRTNFWGAMVLSAIAQYVISGLQPLPYVFSILFFALELRLLVRSRQTGVASHLFWLPLLFVFWANLHIQFVAGLLLLGLFGIAVALEEIFRAHRVTWFSERVLPLDLKQVGIATFLSLLGTFVNPYTVHPLPAAFKVLYSPVGLEHFTEMSAMSFRRPPQFVLMLLVMMAFLALGRLRSLMLFELTALIAATVVAFRIERDGWLAVLTAIAVISSASILKPADSECPVRTLHSLEQTWAAALATVVLVIAAVRLPGPKTLMDNVSRGFPVKACNYIRQNHLPQPLFNEYSWGSFLTWYLPEYPVEVDSRIELYGNDILTSYFDVVGGKQLLESDPMVARAGTLLLEQQSAMAKALATLPKLKSQYRLVYSDDLASVFVPQPRAE
jgi:hypothetical protein